MDEIHHFHETFLHPALVKCGHNLNEIGRVFLEYSDNFEIYSIYCRNSKKSEELRRILGKNAFLQSCQNKLNHALPLSAYLLKPIQRLTKYQLLIEQLVKYNQSGRFSNTALFTEQAIRSDSRFSTHPLVEIIIAPSRNIFLKTV